MAYKDNEIEDIFSKICDKISIDGLALRNILKADDMPSSRTFFKWLDNDDKKVKQYARACEDRADNIFEDILDIADESHADKKVLEDGREVVDSEVVQRSRIRIDARKWMLSKMNPKKYSDKLQVDTTEFKEQPLFPD